MRKRRRLKKKVKYTFLLIIILIFGIVFLKDKKENLEKTNKILNETEILLKKDTYLNNIKNSTNTTIKKSWEEVIIKYLDLYYKALIGLETKEVKSLFNKPDSTEAYYVESAIDLLVYHHKIQPNDMKLTKAKYDIEYTSVETENNIITINLLVDDYINFKYLGNIESKEIDVEYEFKLIKEKDNYKIYSIRVVQGNFVMFTNELEIEKTTIKKIDELKQKYIKLIDEDLKENKELMKEANEEKYETFIECDHGYDREKAVSYAYKYVDARNEKFVAYDDVGGNCQNYVSQSIHTGGIPMDIKGDQEWKHYGDGVNENNEEKGRSTSWTGTINFYEYAANETKSGMCTDVDENIFYAEPGDVAHVGYDGFSHAVIVVKEIFDTNNKKVDFLVNSNTASLENYPFMAYVYPNKRIIKVLGYND